MPVSKEKAIRLIDQQIAKIDAIRRQGPIVKIDSDYQYAIGGTWELISSLFGVNDGRKFQARTHNEMTEVWSRFGYVDQKYLESCIVLLRVYRDKVELVWDDTPEIETAPQPDTIKTLEFIARRLPMMAAALRQRRAPKLPLTLDDEYDVQYFLYPLLLLFFEDVRAEVVTPTYASGSSRIDFVLGNEQVGVEVKKTRPSLNGKELADQLLIDIMRYRQYSDCKTLVGIVLDTDRYIVNPIKDEKDLSQPINGMPVHVFIVQG